LPISNYLVLIPAEPVIDSINCQSAIENRKSLSEWLADPGCPPSIQESNADLETLAHQHCRNEIDGLLLATLSNVSVPG
jgi:hypothetical protein